MSIWVQAVIVIAVGVTISTLVSGPVAMLFTAGFIILGFCRQDFVDIATGKSYGGGPAESVVPHRHAGQRDGQARRGHPDDAA